MTDQQYKVILEGYGAGKGEYYIEQDLAKLFKISAEQAKKLLQSAPKTIKSNLPIAQAEKYEQAIKAAGAKCSVESMQFNLDGLSLQ